MTKNENDFSSETSEAIDKIEEILSGLISFAGRYVVTMWSYLLIPSLSARRLKRENLHRRTLYPLSYLTISLLLFSLSYFRVLKELLKSNWISPESKIIITRIVSYHDSIAESAFTFQIAEALFLMVPLVLFVGLFAKINELISKIVQSQTTIDQQLSSCSYFIGTIASMLALWSLPILYFLANFLSFKTTSNIELAAGYLTIVFAVATISIAFFRYLQDGKNQYFNSWITSCFVFVIASSLQILAIQVTLKLFILGEA